jgi:hypothetical protein
MIKMNKKGIGGPIDILHSLVLILISIFIIKFALGGYVMPPWATVAFFSFLIVAELGALVL